MDYTIDAVARLTGVSAFTLRNWEKRYAFLKPRRMGNGFRTYEPAQIELIRQIAALIKHGAKIGDLAESIQKGRPLPDVPTPSLAPEVQDHAKAMYLALLQYDVERAEAIHSELGARFSTTQMLDLIYAPLLSSVGSDWATGDVSVAQEHFASAFIRLRLAPYLTLLPAPRSGTRRKVVCATTAGELHEGGLMLITAHLRLRGWATFYLGSSLPYEDIEAAVDSVEPEVTCLSFSDKHQLRSALPQLARLKSTRFCVGGFGALTFDDEERLPANVQLFKNGGKEAADLIDLMD